MFIGREHELEVLESFYAFDGFGMAVIYGRRRVGKSTLIAEFASDKNTIFYTATKVNAKRNLELFSSQVLNHFMPELKNIEFNCLEAVFDFITERLQDEKLLLVIDELPFWAERDESFLSVLQKYIDTVWKDKNLKVILCGSILSFMESKVLSEKSPLFGRRTLQIKLDPFDYLDAARFVSSYSCEDKALAFAVTGGIARYLSLIDPDKSINDNIVDLFFRKEGYLYDEARNLLTQEFNDIASVNDVLELVARGENTVNGIATKSGQGQTAVLYTLNKLISVGLVEKRHCITEEKNKKKTQYVLKDNMLKFWFSYIPQATSAIEIGAGEVYFKNIVEPQLHGYMSSVFEEMCRLYTLRHGVAGDFGCMLTRVGFWWGFEMLSDDAGQLNKQSADIDVVGLSEPNKMCVVGECKFRNEKVDRSTLGVLVRRGELLNKKYKVGKYLLFSLAGYTEWYEKLDDDSVVFLTLDDLYN